MTIDEALGPYAGPCALCGRPDKRHRLFDTIRGELKAGASVESICWNSSISEQAVEWIVTRQRFPIIGRNAVKTWRETHGVEE